jgi:hypothetical protein
MMDAKLPNFEPPEELRDFAGRTVEQARRLSNDFFETARKATAGLNGAQFPSGVGAQNVIAKWLEYAEQNTNAGFDHAARLVRAKDIQQAMQLNCRNWEAGCSWRHPVPAPPPRRANAELAGRRGRGEDSFLSRMRRPKTMSGAVDPRKYARLCALLAIK